MREQGEDHAPTLIDVWQLILRQQQSGFPDFGGARAAAFVPVSDRLLTELAAQALPPDAPVTELRIEALPGNVFAVRARLSRAPLVPAVTIALTIVQQPRLPDEPVLVLRIGTSGLMALAGPALRLFKALPPGVRADGDRLLVDLRELLAQRGAGWLLPYLADLQVTTGAGVVLVSFRMEVPERSTGSAPTPA